MKIIKKYKPDAHLQPQVTFQPVSSNPNPYSESVEVVSTSTRDSIFVYVRPPAPAKETAGIEHIETVATSRQEM